MKRKNLIILLLVIVSLSFVAATVEKRAGEQLNLASWANPGPEITFDANTPFHVAHGWGWFFFYGLKEEELFAYMASPGTQKFTLEIDGVDQKFDFFQVGTENKLIFESEGEEYIFRYREYYWVFNYPEGMEGTHTFHATWWMQCKYVYYDACEKPNEPVPASDRTLIVNFIEP